MSGHDFAPSSLESAPCSLHEYDRCQGEGGAFGDRLTSKMMHEVIARFERFPAFFFVLAHFKNT